MTRPGEGGDQVEEGAEGDRQKDEGNDWVLKMKRLKGKGSKEREKRKGLEED